MSRHANQHFAILDLGTSATRLLLLEISEGRLRYAGHAAAPSRGTRKGVVVSLPAAVEGIRTATMELERQTGEAIERVFLSLTGTHVRGLGSQAGVNLTSRSREVTREDAREALDRARSLNLPEDRQILHVVPQEFVLDRQGGIHEPVGMLASRLEARVYAITVSTGTKDNLVLAANQAGLEVQELIYAPLAVAEATLRAEDRYAGVALVDFGAGSTGVLVYNQGSLVHAASVPIGGDHFTNDIAAVFSTPPAEAERIKRDYGAALTGYASEMSEIEVPGPGEGPARSLPHRSLLECIEPRARELVRLVHAEMVRGGGLGAGVVVTGGGRRLTGLPELLQGASGIPVREAVTALSDGMPEELAAPEWAFCVGAGYYGHRLVARQQKDPGVWEKLRQRWAKLGD